ncbi:MAG TPA: dihydrofolate reductase family protein [Kribbella sp.]|nr:dihydrofolate reductase family protein [Kribbella sp.]
MRKLIESTFMTLDGVVSEPQNWSAPYWDEDHNAYAAGLMTDADALVLGRATYEGFAQAWPTRSGDWYTDKINAMPKYVASRTLTELTWNSTVLEGDAAEAVAKLKAADGGHLLKFGTGSFSKTLLEHKLVDEYHLWIFPVVAGRGDRLFDGIDLTHLQLLDATTFKSGIVVHKLTTKD